MSSPALDPRHPDVSNTSLFSIWVIVALLVAIEAVSKLAELAGMQELRSTIWLYAAFWPPLLDGHTGLFAGQGITMFLSYAFLHSGVVHLALNATILLALGRIILFVAGTLRSLMLFALTAAGAAAVYALLAEPVMAPMIGASGVVFGCFGAWKRWELQNYRSMGLSADTVWRFLLGLLALSIVVLLAVSNIAWQAHLGGFLTGWFLAPALRKAPLPLMSGA